MTRVSVTTVDVSWRATVQALVANAAPAGVVASSPFADLLQLIERLRAILASDRLLMQIIVDELKAVKDNYGDGRRTEIIEGDGAILLPGLVDLHTHLREPGREDAETVASGTRAAAAGGFTAVHAMANTDPVADTAGVVEQVWRLGEEAGYADVRPVGAVTVGLAGERLAELGAMADSAAHVRVFSDDGHCVSDALLMRRALEYVKAFDGVIAQHAQEPLVLAQRIWHRCPSS